MIIGFTTALTTLVPILRFSRQRVAPAMSAATNATDPDTTRTTLDVGKLPSS